MDHESPNVLDGDDFESIELIVHFHNLVTGTSYHEHCSIIELGDHTLTLSLPHGACRDQNSMVLEIFRARRGPDQKRMELAVPSSDDASLLLRATGKVLSTTPFDDSSLSARIRLLQMDEKSWETFLELFGKRQASIMDFFATAGDKPWLK